jgi:predicted sulfurtransferase
MNRFLILLLLVPASVVAALAQQEPRQVRMPPELQQVQPVGEDKRVKADDIDKLLADGKVVLLDVREPWELEEFGTREGYINIPLAELEQRIKELPKDKVILTA